MKRILLCFLFILMSGPCFAADAIKPEPAQPLLPPSIDPKARALAQELVKIINVHHEVDGILNKMSADLYPRIEKINLKRAKGIKEMVEEATRQARSKHLKEIDDVTADYYAQAFTVEELQQTVDYYQSPAGKKLLKKMPELIDKSMTKNLDLVKLTMREAMGSILATLKREGLNIPKQLTY